MVIGQVYGIYVCDLVSGVEPPYGENPVSAVVVKAQEQERYLPLFMLAEAANGIARYFQEDRFCQPFTHDLLGQILRCWSGSIESVVIHGLQGTTYWAKLKIKIGTRIEEFDCRPSDAIALGIRFNLPIGIARSILERHGSDHWETAILQKAPPDSVAAIRPMVPELAI